MLITEIYKGIPCSAKSFRKNESNFILSAKLVHCEDMFNALEILRVTNNIEVLVVFQCKLIKRRYFDVGIQFLELVQACLGARSLADMRLF